jgi:16S rRNA (cytosine967-C5)-methyltransferase
MTHQRRAHGKPTPNPKPEQNNAPPGLAARLLAHRLIGGVLIDRQPLEIVLAREFARPDSAALEPRDRAFARSLASTVLRRQGQLDFVLDKFVTRPLPQDAERARICLLAGAAQLLFLETPPHAAVGLAVDAVRRTRHGARYAGMANAVLRRVAAEGRAILATRDAASLNVPEWLLERWRGVYGAETAQRIAEASLREAPLDITLNPDLDRSMWAEKLGGTLLPTGSIRRLADTRVEDLAGYTDGAWWVQDTAASLVTRAAGDVRGRAVADLCAAPGGKTAQLAAAGAKATAVDMSARRLERLAENLRRLKLSAEVVTADATTWRPGRTFDVVVVDAPCTATGTIRRHPDILRLKGTEDIVRLAAEQAALLANAADLTAPGGTLVYSTCSLEPEEGPNQIESFLAAHAQFRRDAVEPAHINGEADWITPNGDVRTLPCHMKMTSPDLSGMDGFFITRLRRHT